MLRSYNGGIVILLLSLGIVGCEEPPEPAHRVGIGELPVHEVDTAKHADADDFQLIQLKDGHDYWFYHDNGMEKGFGGLAHSPECRSAKSWMSTTSLRVNETLRQAFGKRLDGRDCPRDRRSST